MSAVMLALWLLLMIPYIAHAISFKWDYPAFTGTFSILKDASCQGRWAVHAHSLPSGVRMYTDTEGEVGVSYCYAISAHDSSGRVAVSKDMIRYRCTMLRQSMICVYTVVKDALP